MHAEEGPPPGGSSDCSREARVSDMPAANTNWRMTGMRMSIIAVIIPPRNTLAVDGILNVFTHDPGPCLLPADGAFALTTPLVLSGAREDRHPAPRDRA